MNTNIDGNIEITKELTSSMASSATDIQQNTIDFVCQNIDEHLNDSSYFLNHVILCSRNDSIKKINDSLTKLF